MRGARRTRSPAIRGGKFVQHSVQCWNCQLHGLLKAQPLFHDPLHTRRHGGEASHGRTTLTALLETAGSQRITPPWLESNKQGIAGRHGGCAQFPRTEAFSLRSVSGTVPAHARLGLNGLPVERTSATASRLNSWLYLDGRPTPYPFLWTSSSTGVSNPGEVRR
jgi:hypothetical protein